MFREVEEIISLVLRLVGVPAGAIGTTLRGFVGRLLSRRNVVYGYLLSRRCRRGVLFEVRRDDIDLCNVVRYIIVGRRLGGQERRVWMWLQ